MLNVIPATAYRKEEWIMVTGSVTGEAVLIQETIMPGTAVAEDMTRLRTRGIIIMDGEIIAAGMMTSLLQPAHQTTGGNKIETIIPAEGNLMQRRKIIMVEMETIHAGERWIKTGMIMQHLLLKTGGHQEMQILLHKQITIITRAEDGMITGWTGVMISKAIILSSSSDMKGLHQSKGLLSSNSSVMKGQHHSKGRRWNNEEWNAGAIMEMVAAEICSNDQMIITSEEEDSGVEEMVKR
jgi:hypothetical protein